MTKYKLCGGELGREREKIQFPPLWLISLATIPSCPMTYSITPFCDLLCLSHLFLERGKDSEDGRSLCSCLEWYCGCKLVAFILLETAFQTVFSLSAFSGHLQTTLSIFCLRTRAVASCYSKTFSGQLISGRTCKPSLILHINPVVHSRFPFDYPSHESASHDPKHFNS